MSRAAKPPPLPAPPPRSKRDSIADRVLEVLGFKLSDLAEQLYVTHHQERVRDELRRDAIANRFREVLARNPEAADVLRGVLNLVEDRSGCAVTVAVVERDCSCPSKAQPCTHALEAAAVALRTARPGRAGGRDGYRESKEPANGRPGATVGEMKQRVRDGQSTK